MALDQCPICDRTILELGEAVTICCGAYATIDTEALVASRVPV